MAAGSASEKHCYFNVKLACGEVVGDAIGVVVVVGDPEVGNDVAEVEEIEDLDADVQVVDKPEEA